jgi:hypothetical protein
MKRIKLDDAAPAVREFVRKLSGAPNGVELELAGKIIGKLLPPTTLAESDRAALIARGRELVKRARARNEGVSARIVRREIQQAVSEVRGRQPR